MKTNPKKYTWIDSVGRICYGLEVLDKNLSTVFHQHNKVFLKIIDESGEPTGMYSVKNKNSINLIKNK